MDGSHISNQAPPKIFKVKPVVETTSEEASENEEKVETASLETAHEENSASKGSALVEVLKGKNK